MTFSPFFFFFFHFSLFLGFFSLSLTLSLIAHPIRLLIRLAIRNDPNTEPIRNDPFRWTHWRRSRQIGSPSPPNRSPYSSLLLARHHFCLLIVAFACHCHFYRCCFCLPLSLLLACHHWSLIVVVDQAPTTFRLPPTPTLQLPFTDLAPTTLRLPPTPTVRLPFKLFFFFLTTSSMRLLKLYLFIAFLFWFLS